MKTQPTKIEQELQNQIIKFPKKKFKVIITFEEKVTPKLVEAHGGKIRYIYHIIPGIAAAPGVNVLSTVPRGRYESYSGTSMACPHVSGTVGLMTAKIIADERTYDVTYIRTILHDTAEDIGQPADAVGYGLVRADKAVAEA